MRWNTLWRHSQTNCWSIYLLVSYFMTMTSQCLLTQFLRSQIKNNLDKSVPYIRKHTQIMMGFSIYSDVFTYIYDLTVKTKINLWLGIPPINHITVKFYLDNDYHDELHSKELCFIWQQSYDGTGCNVWHLLSVESSGWHYGGTVHRSSDPLCDYLARHS